MPLVAPDTMPRNAAQSKQYVKQPGSSPTKSFSSTCSMQQRWCACLTAHSEHVLSCTVDPTAWNLQSAPNEQLPGESGASRGGTPRSGGSACGAVADARIAAGAPRVGAGAPRVAAGAPRVGAGANGAAAVKSTTSAEHPERLLLGAVDVAGVPHRACVNEVLVAIEPRGGPTRTVLGFAQVPGHAACAGP
ncbi:hypothetical protein M885DRAFT_546708, partial [Pelagophyceae sp. CCMP2097]